MVQRTPSVHGSPEEKRPPSRLPKGYSTGELAALAGNPLFDPAVCLLGALSSASSPPGFLIMISRRTP
jgi:hypothetical protein